MNSRYRHSANLGSMLGSSKSSRCYWATLISATVEQADQDAIVLTFPNAKTVSVGDFVCLVNGVVRNLSSLSWVGAVLTIVAESNFEYGDTITINLKSLGAVAVTNNITHPILIEDGNSVGWYKPNEAANVTAVAGVESIWWDMLYGKLGALGAEQDSGVIVLYAVYKITATQVNFFYAGCVVGDVFVCGTVKTCDANNKVQRYTGNHLTQPTATNRPTNQVFDGVDNFMRTAPFTFTSPLTIYAVIKQVTWTSGDFIIDGVTANHLKLAQGAVTPRLQGVPATLISDDLPVGDWGIVRLIYVGTDRTLIVDDNTPITKAQAGFDSPGGITIGTRGDLPGALWGNFSVKEIIARKVEDDSVNQEMIYDYLKKKYNEDLITEAWLVAGQSNALSNCLVAEQTIPGYNTVLTKGRIWNPQTSAIELITPGTNSSFTYPERTAMANYFGPEVAFLKDLSLAKNIDQIVIKLAEGSTQLKANAGQDWSETSSGEMLDELKEYINDCNAFITAKGRYMRIRGILWVHGESDIDHPVEYGTLLISFFNNLVAFCEAINTANGVPDEDIIKIVSRLSASTGYNPALLALMRTAQTDFITNNGGILIDTDAFELKVDAVHFTADGIITMGQAVAVAVGAIY